MQGLLTKLYQLLIAKDQLVKAFIASSSLTYKVNPAVTGYESFDNQAAALAGSRDYRKLVIKTESLHQKGLRVKEKFFFSNYH